MGGGGGVLQVRHSNERRGKRKSGRAKDGYVSNNLDSLLSVTPSQFTPLNLSSFSLFSNEGIRGAPLETVAVVVFSVH